MTTRLRLLDVLLPLALLALGAAELATLGSEGWLPAVGLEALAATARIVLADDSLRTRLDAWIRGAVETLLVRHRHEISGLIAEVVAAWDADEISRKVEGEIGRDLQYIRINGTLVGGAAGVLLHGLSLAFSP